MSREKPGCGSGPLSAQGLEAEKVTGWKPGVGVVGWREVQLRDMNLHPAKARQLLRGSVC